MFEDPMSSTWHKELEVLGEEGWDLVSVTPHEWQTDEKGWNVINMYCYTFKKAMK